MALHEQGPSYRVLSSVLVMKKKVTRIMLADSCVTEAFSKDSLNPNARTLNFQLLVTEVLRAKTSLLESTPDLYQLSWVGLCAEETNSPTQSSRDGDSSCPSGQSH